MPRQKRRNEPRTHPSNAAWAPVGRRACTPLIALLVLLAPAAYATDPTAKVAAAFERYKAALMARDGAAAISLVTPASLAHHERLRDLALHAPQAVVEALPLADRILVFRLRHEFTAGELLPLSGADLVRLGVEEAWSSPKAMQPLAVAAVEAGGDGGALAAVTRAGEPVPVRLVFRPGPGGGWRLDLVELARGSDAALEAALRSRAERAGVDFHTAVTWAIEDTSGHLVDKDLWRPLAEPAG
jgi:hypothetical protein